MYAFRHERIPAQEGAGPDHHRWVAVADVLGFPVRGEAAGPDAIPAVLDLVTQLEGYAYGQRTGEGPWDGYAELAAAAQPIIDRLVNAVCP